MRPIAEINGESYPSGVPYVAPIVRVGSDQLSQTSDQGVNVYKGQNTLAY